MRATVLFPLLLCATPLFSQTSTEDDLLPAVSHDLALTCLALWVVNLETDGAGIDPVVFAQEMVFFSRIIAQRATPDEAASFYGRLAKELDQIRSWRAALDNPATKDEADFDLTGTGKMCWFQALAAEGGPYEGQ